MKIPTEQQETIELCQFCGHPIKRKDEIQAVCVALLDIQTSASDEQILDHLEAIEVAKEIMRSYIRRSTRRHYDDCN